MYRAAPHKLVQVEDDEGDLYWVGLEVVDDLGEAIANRIAPLKVGQ